MPEISVVIPVWGAEKWISECAESLFSQTLGEMEFIFVDDCSPDRSIEILRDVIKKYPERAAQVKILSLKRNCGVSAARRAGVEIATGNYIIHCDPDDRVEPDMYESLLNRAQITGADVTLCDFFNDSAANSVSSRSNLPPPSLEPLTLLGQIAGSEFQREHGSLCNKLVSRACYKGVTFPEGINYCEDVYVLFQILQKPIKIAYLNRPLYHYRVDTPDSLVKTVTEQSLDMDLGLISLLDTQFARHNNPRVSAAARALITAVIYHRAFLSSNLSNREFKKRYRNYNKYIPFFKMHLPQRFALRMAFHGYRNIGLFLHNSYGSLRYTVARIAGS